MKSDPLVSLYRNTVCCAPLLLLSLPFPSPLLHPLLDRRWLPEFMGGSVQLFHRQSQTSSSSLCMYMRYWHSANLDSNPLSHPPKATTTHSYYHYGQQPDMSLFMSSLGTQNPPPLPQCSSNWTLFYDKYVIWPLICLIRHWTCINNTRSDFGFSHKEEEYKSLVLTVKWYVGLQWRSVGLAHRRIFVIYVRSEWQTVVYFLEVLIRPDSSDKGCLSCPQFST